MMLAASSDVILPSLNAPTKLIWHCPVDEEFDAGDVPSPETKSLCSLYDEPVTVASANNTDDLSWLESYLPNDDVILTSVHGSGSINSQHDDAVAKLFEPLVNSVGSIYSASGAILTASFTALSYPIHSSLPPTPPQSPHGGTAHPPSAQGAVSSLGLVSSGNSQEDVMHVSLEDTLVFGCAEGNALEYQKDEGASPILHQMKTEVVAVLSPVASITSSIEYPHPAYSPLSSTATSSISEDVMSDPTYDPMEDSQVRTISRHRPSTSTASPVICPGGVRRRGRKPDKATAALSKEERKRYQNRKAATRYREKKKAESCIVDMEEELLIERNLKLSLQFSKVRNEYRILKNLFRDLLRKKGVFT